MADGLWERLTRMFGRAISGPPRPARPSRPVPGPPRRSPSRPGGSGDFTGKATLVYAPRDDGRPDPGEIVWAWVPFEEDRTQGKDRPVLVVARDGTDLLALMLTSKDHDRDAAQEARYGRHWMDIGSGDWDRAGRPSEVRLDRILRLDPNTVRREGAALDRATFEQVATGVRRVQRW